MTTLKLITGQRVNLTVASVEQVQGNFGPQYAFKGETPDDDKATLYVNIEAADRQLARLGYDTHSVIGQTIEIARTERDGRKYTDFNRPSTLPQPNTKPVATERGDKTPYSLGGPLPYETETGAPPLPNPTPRLDALFTLYDVCFDHAFQLAHKKLGNDCTHEGIAAQAATLFIAAKP